MKVKILLELTVAMMPHEVTSMSEVIKRVEDSIRQTYQMSVYNPTIIAAKVLLSVDKDPPEIQE